MSPFFALIALGPISIYLLLIGRMNLSRRPLIMSGTRDTLALALATSGLAVVGPLNLFLPEAAAGWMGPWVWLPLISLYALCSLLIALLMRPRLVVYNITSEQLRPVLESVASKLDSQRRWAGNALFLPSLGIQLTLEPFPSMRNVQLVAFGGVPQDLVGWRCLELELRQATGSMRVEMNPRGLSFLMLGTVLVGLIVYGLNRNPETLAQSLRQFLRM